MIDTDRERELRHENKTSVQRARIYRKFEKSRRIPQKIALSGTSPSMSLLQERVTDWDPFWSLGS